MKRNRMLASAVVLVLGCSGTAMAQTAAECSSEAVRLKTEVGNSKIADAAKTDLTKALDDAKDADAARCEQVVSRVRRELGIGPEAPDSSSGNNATSTSGSSPSYEAGHASANESLPKHPGAAANDSSASGVSASGEAEQGDASAQETLKTKTVPARADTGSKGLSSMSANDLVDKPVKSSAGKELGKIAAIVTDKAADAQGYAVISSGGKRVLVDIDQLKVAEDGSLQLPMSDPKDFAAYPEYVEENYTEYDGAIAQIL
jgi:hypothetical protein